MKCRNLAFWLALTLAAGSQAKDTQYQVGYQKFKNIIPIELMQLGQSMHEYPAAPDATRKALMQGDILFFKHDWQGALDAYNFADPHPEFIILSSFERPQYQYRRAIALLETGRLDESAKLFNKLTRQRNFRGAAYFYIAYIDMEQGNLEKARAGFEEAAQRKLPAGLYPSLYLGQLDYLEGDYAKALSVAEEAVAAIDPSDTAAYLSALRLAGMSAFMLDNTASALPMLEKYATIYISPDNSSIYDNDPDAMYAYAASLYDNGLKSDAEAVLNELTSRTTLPPAVWQGSLLLLGQLTAESDPNAAALLFERAYRSFEPTNADESMAAQAALYNFSAARAHGGNIPFSNAARDLEAFASLYPDSKYTPDVLYSLANQYFNHTDFNAALKGIDRIKNPGNDVLALKQRILYRKGISATINEHLQEAAQDFQAAIDLGNFDRELSAQLHLWLGDVMFRNGLFKQAASQYSSATGSLKGDNAALAIYNLGYALMKDERYEEAAKQLIKAADDKSLPSSLRADARLRAADCQLYAGNHSAAAKIYAEATKDKGLSGADRDYALLRQATALGVDGNLTQKIEMLESLRKGGTPKWMPYILSELGDTYYQSGDNALAISTMQELMKRYPKVSQVPHAMLVTAQALVRSGDTAAGISAYETLLKQRPNTDEATEADSELRKLHADAGTLSAYAEFLKSIPGGRQLGAAEQEQLAFEAAMDALAENQNLSLLRTYVTEYPEGRNIAEAINLLADNELETGNKAEALALYRKLEECGGVTYAATAAAGIMRLTPDAAERTKYARMLLTEGGAGAEVREEAKYYEANGLMETGKATEAVKLYETLAKYPQGEWGARSAVALGEYWLNAKKPTKALKVLTDFIDAGSNETYWLAKAYILLADTYTAQGKKSLAKQYLETLRDNYPGDEQDIADMISERLSKLN